ncbi:serine hydrolase domain-containing protein [Cytobacillus sp. FJAT-54145]|uniref:Serine hydrolase domain-containing protein n=1 Tax=Cytobacillus spartinae TaxID=3299023 RepID=A0ABW6K8N4_9BACI
MQNPVLQKLDKRIKDIKVESLVIRKDHQLIYEYQKNKKMKEKSFKIYSITKAVIGLLIGIAKSKELILDLHTPIYHYFSEIVLNDERKKEITIHHLLSMTSGLQWSDTSGSGGNLSQTKNWVKFTLDQPLLHKPGEVFQYSCGSSHLLSAIITKVSGMTTDKFAEEYLFGPLQIKKHHWLTDPQGIPGGGFSLNLNTEDLMKLGILCMEGGCYKGKRVISSGWITQMTSPQKLVEESGMEHYSYGYQWWILEDKDLDNSLQLYYAAGLFGQYIIVIPKLKIISVIKSQLKAEDQHHPFSYVVEMVKQLYKEELTAIS